MGLDVSVRPGWTPVWACWVSPEPADTFSSSLLLRQAALGFKLRSVDSEREKKHVYGCRLWSVCSPHLFKGINIYLICGYYHTVSWPLTCCSRLSMTATAWWRISSFVCGFSLFRCSWHMRPSSLKASLMSRTLKRSRALLAILLSRSRSAFCSGLRSSSSVILRRTEPFYWIRHGMKINIILSFSRLNMRN